MRKILYGAVVAGTLLAAGGAEAQGVLPFSLEARGGLAFPQGDFPSGDGRIDGPESGVGFGANATFSFLPGVAVYAGWDRYSFGVDEESGLDEDAEFVDEGFSVGARLSLPISFIVGVSPWVRGGALIRTLELTDDGGTGDNESDRSVGYEVGGGIDIPLGLVLSFTPGVIYRSYSPDFDAGEGDGDASYFDVSIGLRARI